MERSRSWAVSVAIFALAISVEAAAFAQEQLPGGGPPPAPMVPEGGATPAPPPPPAHAEAGAEWTNFKFEGVHPFVGLTFLGGPAFAVLTGPLAGSANQLEGAFLFALRAGVYVDRNEFAFEVSPLTYQYYTNTGGPAFQLTGTYGYLFPIATTPSLEVSWPIRVGVGVMTGNTADLVYFQARADLIGLNLRTGPLIIDLYFPQFRYAVTAKDGEGAHILTWFGGASLSYAL